MDRRMDRYLSIYIYRFYSTLGDGLLHYAPPLLNPEFLRRSPAVQAVAFGWSNGICGNGSDRGPSIGRLCGEVRSRAIAHLVPLHP